MNDQIKATKACPFCGEEILAVAIKCKHCSEMLSKRETNNDQESKSRVIVHSLEVQNYCCPSCLEIIPADTISCFNCGANSSYDREWQPVQSVKFESEMKDDTITTQLTSKTIKLHYLISIGIALLGFVIIPNPLGIFILSIAAIWLVVTWFIDWWDHG